MKKELISPQDLVKLKDALPKGAIGDISTELGLWPSEVSAQLNGRHRIRKEVLERAKSIVRQAHSNVHGLINT